MQVFNIIVFFIFVFDIIESYKRLKLEKNSNEINAKD